MAAMTSATTIILVLYFIQGSLGHALRQSPIVGVAGGHAVDIEHAPFMAAVFSVDTDPYFWCGGSIIHEQFVLTAALCIDFGNIYTYIVRVGSTRKDEGGKLHQVEKYIQHESFSYETWYLYNVALLKLSVPVTFGPSVSLIKLADASVNISAGLAANITGWGRTDLQNYADESRELRQASLTVSAQDECNKYYNNIYGRNLTDKQVCVNNKATGACSYDYGVPLTAGDLQIGIFLYGATCWGKPNVYEKVAPHLQWIRNKIKTESLN